jgi:hypothetical protein
MKSSDEMASSLGKMGSFPAQFFPKHSRPFSLSRPEEAYAPARNLASKMEQDLHYPGQIKITPIRETRCIEVAK